MADPTIVKPNMLNEQIVLGNMLRDGNALERVMLDSHITEQTFLAARHQIIYLILEKMYDKGLIYNEDTFVHESEKIDFGGVVYLNDMIAMIEPNQNLDHHIKVLKEDYVKKVLLTKELPELEKSIRVGDEADLTPIHDKLADMEQILEGSVETHETVVGEDALMDTYRDFMLERADRKYSAFYFPEFDEKLSYGAYPGLITVMAAVTGQGKSTTCANIVQRWVFHDVPVLWCPQEEGGMRSLDKIVSSVSGVESMKFKKEFHKLKAIEKYEIMKAVKMISERPLYIYNSPDLSMKDLALIIKKLKIHNVVIDLFEKLSDLKGSKEQEVIARNLDEFQKFTQRHHVHSLITAQIQRDKMKGKKADARRPTLDSIKNTGAYAEVADLLVGLYRDNYFNPDTDRPDVIEWHGLKQRDGEAPFCINYMFEKEHSRIGAFVPRGEGDIPF